MEKKTANYRIIAEGKKTRLYTRIASCAGRKLKHIEAPVYITKR